MTLDEIIKQLRDMAKHPTVTLPRDCEALRTAADLLEQKSSEEFAVYAVDIARRAVAFEREACADLVFYMAQNTKGHTDKPTWVVLHEAQDRIRKRGKA